MMHKLPNTNQHPPLKSLTTSYGMQVAVYSIGSIDHETGLGTHLGCLLVPIFQAGSPGLCLELVIMDLPQLEGSVALRRLNVVNPNPKKPQRSSVKHNQLSTRFNSRRWNKTLILFLYLPISPWTSLAMDFPGNKNHTEFSHGQAPTHVIGELCLMEQRP